MRAALAGTAFAAAMAAKSAIAHCPLCAAATAGGVAAARFLGVDDTVVGTFIGGFAVSTGLWFGNWVTKKRKPIPFQRTISVMASISLTIFTLYMARLLGAADPSLKMLGVDKLIVGLAAGAGATIIAFWLHKRIRTAMGRSIMPFQGIAITLILLAITGFAFYIVS